VAAYLCLIFIWAFPFLKKERAGLSTSISPSAKLRKGRIYAAIPNAALNYDGEIFLFIGLRKRKAIDPRI